MAVNRGQKILQADMDALAAAANARANLEGKPFAFLPRRWIIKTPNVPARDFPPGWPNQGTSGVWDAASLSRLAGLQVGDVVINLKTGKFPFRCSAVPTVNQNGTWTGGSWIDLRNNPGTNPRWYIVNDFAERDALGAVQDGSICFIINNQPADLSIQGYFLEVRQGGQWKYYRGWAGELSRLRWAIGKLLDIHPGEGFAYPYAALISDRYQGAQFGSGAPAWWFDNPMPIGTPNPDVSTMQSLEIYWPDPATVSFRRTIILPWIHAQVGGQWRTGFKGDFSQGGTLSGSWSSSYYRVEQDDPAHPVALPDFPNYFKSQLTGPLAPFVVSVSNNTVSGGLAVIFAGNIVPNGEMWLGWNFSVPAGLHFSVPPDGKFYRSIVGSPNGSDNLTLIRDFTGAGEVAVGLHTKRSIRKLDLRNDRFLAGALDGSNLNNPYYAFLPGGNFATVNYAPTISGADQYTRLLTTQRTVPIGVGNPNGDGTEMDAYRVQFALRQFDYVPAAADLVAVGTKGQYARTVSTQSRGPNLFPNGPELFPPQNHNPAQDNIPHACACKVYPVVYDPEGATNYAAFSTAAGKGQIIRITAVRIPEENDEGQANLPENPGGSIDVQVGCYRNGAFVNLAMISIPVGKNYGVWDRAADTPGIMVWEFYPLAVKCTQRVQVYPLWFNAAYSGGLGDGNLLEIPGPNFAPASFTAVCPPIMPDHYNETIALLSLP